ncbi:hypothetical protein [Acinetobacter baumannii]|uniref:hypothetical protein n=1 Tax=Acinetobacter calcoaceticus/baumannii complex TaxID=909768 RepID=UPI00092B8A67|nr:hypothetical protein [Acinetobacter baumannii]OJK06370.1 hypothetical protein BRY75_13775 [Acinetobacter baumannii]
MTNFKVRYWVFIILTGCYFFILYNFFGITPDQVKTLPPNEIGDFLAGAFSPLAFLFLILGYLQNTQALKMQSKELKASTDALNQQAIQLTKNVEEQRRLFSVTKQELEIKHFEARPHLTFYSYPFTITEKEFPSYHEDGSIIDMDYQEVADIAIFIDNKGEVARLISFEELNSDFDDFNIEIYELASRQKTKVDFELMGERLACLQKESMQDLKLKITYHDKYGRQYSEILEIHIYALRDGLNYFGISTKRIFNYNNVINE